MRVGNVGAVRVGVGIGGYYPYGGVYGGSYLSPGYGYSAYADPTYSAYAYPQSSVIIGGTAPTQAFYNGPIGSDPLVNTTVVDVRAREAGALVWFDGAPTTQLGEWRNYSSPPLTPGTTYQYKGITCALDWITRESGGCRRAH